MWKLWLLAGAAALVASFVAGWAAHGWRDGAAQVRAAQAAIRTVQRQAAASQVIAVRDQRGQDRIRTVTRRLIEKVPIYVTPESDRAYPLPWGFVRLHDAAVRGDDLSAAADRSGGADDAPSDVAASEAAGVIVANYGGCRADRQRLADLQAWARRMGLAP
jgi:hypothetical protein